jgi:hypothetical protein
MFLITGRVAEIRGQNEAVVERVLWDRVNFIQKFCGKSQKNYYWLSIRWNHFFFPPCTQHTYSYVS